MSNPAERSRITNNALSIWRLASSLAIVLLLIPLASLAATQSATPEVRNYSGGVSISLACTPGQCRQEDRQDVFTVEPGTPLQIEFGFVQSYPEAKEFRVFLLLNYQQTPFAVRQDTERVESDWVPLGTPFAISGNGEMAPVLEFTAPPERELYFNLWTEPLAAGYYDLALLVVPDPQQTQRELPYWSIYRFPSRASVYVGESATPPTVDFPLIDPAPHYADGNGELLLFGHEPYNLSQKGEQAVRAGEDFTLAMNYQPYAESMTGNPAPDIPVTAAFVTVLDDRVVPINGQAVVYGSALPGRISYFPVTVTAPDDPGSHQLFVQHFPNPYVDVGVADETGRDLFAMSSQRLTLDVR